MSERERLAEYKRLRDELIDSAVDQENAHREGEGDAYAQATIAALGAMDALDVFVAALLATPEPPEPTVREFLAWLEGRPSPSSWATTINDVRYYLEGFATPEPAAEPGSEGRRPDAWAVEWEPGELVVDGDTVCTWRNRAKAEDEAEHQRRIPEAWDGVRLVPVYFGTPPAEHPAAEARRRGPLPPGFVGAMEEEPSEDDEFGPVTDEELAAARDEIPRAWIFHRLQSCEHNHPCRCELAAGQIVISSRCCVHGKAECEPAVGAMEEGPEEGWEPCGNGAVADDEMGEQG